MSVGHAVLLFLPHGRKGRASTCGRKYGCKVRPLQCDVIKKRHISEYRQTAHAMSYMPLKIQAERVQNCKIPTSATNGANAAAWRCKTTEPSLQLAVYCKHKPFKAPEPQGIQAFPYLLKMNIQKWSSRFRLLSLRIQSAAAK
eukprot:scaffold11657_cov19-Tisochrysis_lutea.AAC.1